MNATTESRMLDVQTKGDAALLFQEEWCTYRKLVDNNYLFHTEASHWLHKTLTEERVAPFRLLDLACGDASTTIIALRGTSVADYVGIDLSRQALKVARENLRVLKCPVELRHDELGHALKNWHEPVDVVWIGLSLHHFRAPAKLSLMRQVRRILGRVGLFVIYENTSPDGEEREEWMQRWDLQQPLWKAFSSDEWHAVTSHVHENDFPETASRWHKLGREAAFNDVHEVFIAPSNLFRMYCFRT
jgi:SAM-dependent methyltransferase